MQMRIAVLVSLALVGWAGCAPPNQLPPTPPPTVESFTASKTEIGLGESVTLSFKVKEATRAVVLDNAGTELLVKESSQGTLEGSIEVTPPETRFYVLRVEGGGGSAADFLQVAVGEPLRDVALLAVPAEVTGGQETQLLWTARNAEQAVIRSSSGEELPVEGVANGSGVMTIRPSRTTGFSLVAKGPGHPDGVTATAHVFVRPVLSSFTVSPQAVEAGEPVTLTFQSRGATEVSIREATFGLLPDMPLANPSSSEETSLTWTVPSQLPSGQAVVNGMPLVFTLTLKSVSPPVEEQHEAYAVVGGGPAIIDFAAPTHVTQGNPVTLSWKTVNASGLEIQRNGQTVVEFFGVDSARIARGSYTFPALPDDAPVNFKVVARNVKSLVTERSVTVTPIPLPVIKTLTLSKPTITSLGDTVTADWTTEHASRVELFMTGGAPIRTVTNAQVAVGAHTFRPGVTGALQMRAYNLAGDYVETGAPIRVDANSGVQLSHGTMLKGSAARLEYTITMAGMSVESVYGAPTTVPAPIEDETSFNAVFEDIANRNSFPDARTVTFTEANGLTAVTPGEGFRFPLLDGSYGRFYVGENGLVVLEPGYTTMGNNQLFDDSAEAQALPTLLAPYWDDLRLGEESRVVYYLKGTEFPRTLIIQWNLMEMGNSTSDRLTFQVKLSETGEMLFLYQDLQGEGLVNGQDATIGYNVSGGRLRAAHVGASDFEPKPYVASKQGLRWFSTESFLAAPLQFTAMHSGQLSLTARLTGEPAQYMHVSLPLRVVRPDAIHLSEAMPNPIDFEDGAGFWLELHNTTHEAIPLSGMALKSTGMVQPLLLTSPKVLQPDEHFVLGFNQNTTLNGGVEVDELLSTDLTFNRQGDTLQLLLPGSQVLSSLGWTSEPARGRAVQNADLYTVMSGGTKDRCEAVHMFNETTEAYGTPGAPNTNCFPDYQMTRIPVAFEDVSRMGGEPLFAVGDWDDDTALVELTGAPVPLFGEVESAIIVSANGSIAVPGSSLLTPGSGTSDVSKYWNYSTSEAVDTPASKTPNGAFVLYANDLWRAAPLDSNVYLRYVAEGEAGEGSEAHWVVQWNKVRFFSDDLAAADDNLNFQVKLFESGVVEFHYGAMQSPLDQVNYADGEHGVALLENRDGSRMLRVSSPAAGPGIRPNTAYRFTPRAQ